MRRAEEEKGVEEWGGIWWKVVGREGDFMEAKVERLEVKPESANVAFKRGGNVPEFKLVEADDNDEVNDVEVEK